MKKNIFLWGLYDFANTPLTAAIGGLYLAQWVVLDNHLDDIWFSGVFVAVTIALLVTSPFLGAWSDKIGQRMPFLKVTTYALIITGTLIGLIATSALPTFPRAMLVLFLFFLVQYFYQSSLIFYNALITQLSSAKNIGKISGIGQFFSELGWLLGPALLLPFANKTITLFGEPGRGQVFLPSVLILAILGLPMIFWFKETKNKHSSQKINLAQVCFQTIEGLKSLFKNNKNAAVFLVAFMFVSDALLTAQLYFAIYLDQVFKISDNEKYLTLALLEIVAIPSVYILGRLGDRFGLKRLLILSCVNLTVVFVGLSLTNSLTSVYILAGLVGLGFAGFYTTTRALLPKISPASQHGQYFGFYSTFQKFASIIGPLVWGIIVFSLKDMGIIKYRWAIASMAALILLGTYLFTKVESVQGLGRGEKKDTKQLAED